MDWSNERYVRVYTRDTPEWLCLSFLAQGLFALLLRKVSRAGVLELGKVGRRGVFIAIGHGHQAAMLDPALDELLADGCVQLNGSTLVVPNFLEAQETPASEAQRQRNHREKVRDNALSKSQVVTPGGHDGSRDSEPRDASVTNRDAPVTARDQTVTVGHALSRPVTPSLAVPCRAEPSLAAAGGGKTRRVVKGPLAAQFVRLVSAGLGHGLAALTDSGEAETLEAAVRALGGPEEAKNVVASTCRSRGEKCDPQSERLLLTMLLDHLPAGVDA